MKIQSLAAAGLFTLLSTQAFAAVVNSDTLPADDTVVTLHGSVDEVLNERSFKLRDKAGTITIDIESNQSVTLKKGDEVAVTGKVDRDINGTDINATRVYVGKGALESLSDAVKGAPGVSTLDAKVYDIDKLPNEGMVKLTGTVSDVDNEKEFTLRDKTGDINVDIVSGENAALTEGAEVTVIGSVDNDLTGKDINATEVIVLSNAKKQK